MIRLAIRFAAITTALPAQQHPDLASDILGTPQAPVLAVPDFPGDTPSQAGKISLLLFRHRLAGQGQFFRRENPVHIQNDDVFVSSFSHSVDEFGAPPHRDPWRRIDRARFELDYFMNTVGHSAEHYGFAVDLEFHDDDPRIQSVWDGW